MSRDEREGLWDDAYAKEKGVVLEFNVFESLMSRDKNESYADLAHIKSFFLLGDRPHFTDHIRS
jgi:hypothetical protein